MNGSNLSHFIQFNIRRKTDSSAFPLFANIIKRITLDSATYPNRQSKNAKQSFVTSKEILAIEMVNSAMRRKDALRSVCQ